MVSYAQKTKGSVMKIRALLAALCCVVGLVFVSGCGKKADAGKGEKKVEKKQDAVAAFNEWRDAIVKGDVAKAKALTVKEHKKEAEAMVAMVKGDAEFNKIFAGTKVVSSTNDGDSATLKVKNSKGEGEVKMVKEDGKWKVGDLK